MSDYPHSNQEDGVYSSFTGVKELSSEEKLQLIAQNRRLVPTFKAKQLESNAQRYWDLFYKRNETRFFKDRHWTTREFKDLLAATSTECSEFDVDCNNPATSGHDRNGNSQDNMSNEHKPKRRKHLLEIGCGVGNLIYPLIEECRNDYFYYACDFSPRAIELVKNHLLYDLRKIHAFVCDITTSGIHETIESDSVDIITMIFVLSAIHPDKFDVVIKNLWKLLRPGGVVLFRDYGLYDMAQIRFKPGHKIAENFYMRQDGTRSYYFSTEELQHLFTTNGFAVVNNAYVNRRTINQKEKIDVPRIFIQGKFEKIIIPKKEKANSDTNIRGNNGDSIDKILKAEN